MESGERLRRLREDRGLSAAELAQRVGRSESAVRNQENGTNGIPATLAAKYAKALGSTASYILYGEQTANHSTQLTPTFLPVRYRVQAGLWIEVEEFVDEFPAPERPVAPDNRFAQWRQWLELVVGDSVDQAMPDGSFAHVVDAIEMGYAPQKGHFVVVERRRAGGQLRERTIKQVDVVAGEIQLWPRSTNAKWASPLILDEGCGNEDVEVEIVGLVIGSYKDLM